MALPTRMKVDADLHFCGGAAKVVALDKAVELHRSRGDSTDDEVIDTAKKFAGFLTDEPDTDEHDA